MNHRGNARLWRPLAWIAAIAMMLGVAAPVTNVAAQETTTITWFTFTAVPDHEDTLDAMIAAFEAANPDVKIEVQTAAYADYFTELQTRIAGGDAPDAFELNYENFVSYASRDVLADLSAFAGAEDGFADRFYPRAYEAFEMDGVQYGLPTSFSDVVLFYNKDLFGAAGVAYPTADWTWEDEKNAAAALTNADEGVWGAYSPITFHELYKTAAQNGCNFFGEDGSVTISEPGCVEALEYLYSFQAEGYQPSDADMAGVPNEDLFLQGQLAMLTTGIWLLPNFAEADFEWGIAVEPGNTQKASHFFSNSAVVSADSEKQEAAWRWISFLAGSDETAQIRVEASWELPAVTNQAVFDSYLSQTPPDDRQPVFDSLEFAVVPPVIEQQAQMQDAVNKVCEAVRNGDMTPQEALDQAKTDIEALIAS
jgi:multiple sugar transport system substrate-binding protein